MSDLQHNFWHQRFNETEYFYGTEPNDFLKKAATQIAKESTIISLGEGEGRNAVFLAEQDHRVTAVDMALSGLKKTQELAHKRGVEVMTEHADLSLYELEESAWDVVISIFCHMPSVNRVHLHQQIRRGLKSGGLFISECYSTEQPNFGTGGPKSTDLLYTIEELERDFADFDILHLSQLEREIYEGEGHTGLSSVIQIIARKR